MYKIDKVKNFRLDQVYMCYKHFDAVHLMNAFTWKTTVQGDTFWRSIYDRLCSGHAVNEYKKNEAREILKGMIREYGETGGFDVSA